MLCQPVEVKEMLTGNVMCRVIMRSNIFAISNSLTKKNLGSQLALLK
jgi:hypothetical protein